MAQPGAHRFRTEAGAELDRERRTRRRPPPHRSTGDRTRHRHTVHRVTEVGGAPKRRFEAIEVMAKEGLPVQTACRVLEVSESGFYEWRNRPPSERSLRHAWLTQLITEVHTASHGTYGARRVHAELTLGHGIAVGHGCVELLMRTAGVKGLPGNKRARSKHQTPTASDLVDRKFTRDEPNKLWVTDITEHPTREGKIYCAVVLDTFSRRVVGWSIDSSQTATLVTNALGMAISNRGPTPGTLIHSDSETVRAGVFGFPDRYRMETRECWCREFPVFLTLTPIDDRVSFLGFVGSWEPPVRRYASPSG
ncbi:IS3 family transposase [Rhodococcus qingshengii]